MKLKTIIFGTICFMASACTERFFEMYPSNQITENTYFQTVEDFKQAVASCYLKLKSEISWHVNELAYRADECQLESMTVSTKDRYNIDHFEENSSTALLSTIWSTWYNGIYRCNDALDHMSVAEFEIPEQLKGELLFIRSWHYFNLYRTFGVVPITTKVVSPEESKTIPRCTQEQMLERLTTDLTEAAALLPAARPVEKARVTKIAAQTLLGKVYLTFGKTKEAKAVLEEAMKDSAFGLMSSTEAAFNVKNKMNKEIIFAVYYDKSTDDGHGYWYNAGTSVKKDIRNPQTEFKDLYSGVDNRLALIDTYREITANKLYAMKKWDDDYDATYTTSVGNDFPHLRYADLLLMYAEACFGEKDYQNANVYINKTRTRAGLAYQEFSKEEFIYALAEERGKEFALEGQRWYDLVRLGLAKEVFAEKGMKDHNVVFPIPLSQLEIINDESILWQNKGF